MQPQRLMADVDEHRPATATDDTRTLSARRATHTPHKQARHMRMLCADKATEPPRMRPRGWPTRHFLHSAQHGRNESGRSKGMHGQRSGTPARGRCRRRSSPRTHAGVLQTPCSRADHLVAHRAASGEIMPVQSCRSGPSSSKHTKHGSQTARRRSAEGRRARRVGSGRCVGLTGAWRWCRGKRVQGCGRRLDQQAGMQRTGSGRRGVGGTWPRWAPPAPPPRRPHFRSRWRGWGRRSGRPGRSSADMVASFCLPRADSTSVRGQKVGVVGEARIGTGGAPETIRHVASFASWLLQACHLLRRPSAPRPQYPRAPSFSRSPGETRSSSSRRRQPPSSDAGVPRPPSGAAGDVMGARRSVHTREERGHPGDQRRAPSLSRHPDQATT